MKAPTACSICKHIPAHKFVETLHTNERLPEQVTQLIVLGGYGLYGSEQVRKCPECAAYYSFLHDHDSESGVGYGYTDEAITRLSAPHALKLIEKTIQSAIRAVAYWQKESNERNAKHALQFVAKHREELQLLEAERELLQKNPDAETPT